MRRTAPEPAAPLPTSASRQWKDNLDFRFNDHQVQIHGGSCVYSCFEYRNLRCRNRVLIIMPPPPCLLSGMLACAPSSPSNYKIRLKINPGLACRWDAISKN
ncbi:hypothetical protein AVEN_3482-1 [Araneus ventricosus]|uniref:Uncharacterized protein n=1 Tax=Araneus ventricosus TaxID=182803 RepID=A0A4Y2FLM7_ARAVE|nr:hypothetical protein AVEN_3482-1 [Araneus ventricosus]